MIEAEVGSSEHPTLGAGRGWRGLWQMAGGNALRWHSELASRMVLSQSPCIVCADQVLCQVCCRSSIIVRSGRQEFPPKMMGVVPGYPSHLEEWKIIVRKLLIGNDISSQAYAPGENHEICLPFRRVIQSVEINHYIISRKITVVWSSSLRKPHKSQVMVKLALMPNTDKYTSGYPRSVVKVNRSRRH